MTCTSSTVANFNSFNGHYPKEAKPPMKLSMKGSPNKFLFLREIETKIFLNKDLPIRPTHDLTQRYIFQSQTIKLVWNPVWDLQTVLYICKVGGPKHKAPNHRGTPIG